MKLHEYQAKRLFIKYDLPILEGCVCTTPHEAEKVVSKIGSGPWIVKCQIHAGGRSKAGGVKIVKKKEEIFAFAKYWIGRRLVTSQTDDNGQLVNQILVEKVMSIETELYLSIIVDYNSLQIVFLTSTEGGIEIEKTAESSNVSSLIYKAYIDPILGPMPYQGREIAIQLGIKGKLIQQFTKIFMKLVVLFLERDLSLIEINPLAIDSKGNLICLDAKISVDSNAIFRQLDLYNIYDYSQKEIRETQATKLKLNYIAMKGNIGCIANGAGLAMSTMDMIKSYGGDPANFLDISGSATKESIVEALKIVISDENVKAILVNIFGGIIGCDLIADGIISVIEETNINIVIVIRLEGNNAELGMKKLHNKGLNIFVTKNLIDAIQKVIAVTKKLKNNGYIN